MFKIAVIIFAVIACGAAKPGFIGAALAYTAPAAVFAAPAPVVTATSSQYVARNHNGIASAPVIAPVAPVVGKTIAAPFIASAAYAAPLAYSTHLHYAPASAPVFL